MLLDNVRLIVFGFTLNALSSNLRQGGIGIAARLLAFITPGELAGIRAPVAVPAKGAFVITPSMLCHSQAIPSSSSYSCNPACQMRSNTPCCSQSRKRS